MLYGVSMFMINRVRKVNRAAQHFTASDHATYRPVAPSFYALAAHKSA